MKRLLALAIVCGASSQFGAIADNRNDSREDSQWAPDRPGWVPVPKRQRGPEPVAEPVTEPVTGPVTAPVTREPGQWKYYETGPGSGYWVYVTPTPESDPRGAGAGPLPAPTSLEPVTIEDAPGGALVPPAPVGPPRNGPEIWLEPIPDERFGHPEQGPVANPALTLRPGEFARGPVAQYPWVKVDSTRNIAPGAVQAVVAVRHPLICPFPCRCHREQVAFVEVWVPPGPARRVLVEKHGTEVELDYGSHQVTIESEKGRIKVKYHD